MIWDLLEWLLQLNQNDQLVTAAKRPSDLVFIAYLVTFKKSWQFAVAFLLCEILANLSFFGIFDSLQPDCFGALFYLALCLTWSLAVSSQIKPKMNGGLAFWCSIMILFLFLMSMDSWINHDTETYIYRNYENIVVCIHACIILSLYKPRAIIDGVVNKFRVFIAQLCGSYTVQFICYNLQQCKKHFS